MTLLAYVQRRIDSIERAPRTWGDNETLEVVMITLLEVRAHIIRPIALEADPYEVRDFWCRETQRIAGENTNWCLESVLKLKGLTDHMPKILGDFARKYLEQFPPEA